MEEEEEEEEDTEVEGEEEEVHLNLIQGAEEVDTIIMRTKATTLKKNILRVVILHSMNFILNQGKLTLTGTLTGLMIESEVEIQININIEKEIGVETEGGGI